MNTSPSHSTKPEAAVSTRRPTVSLLVTFDIGQTFVFKSTGKHREEVVKEWGEVFSGHPHEADWCTEQWADYSKPMGWIATWRYFYGSDKPELKAAVDQLREAVPGELDDDKDAIRAIIFPNGIGVLIVRSRAAVDSTLNSLYNILIEEKKKENRRAACGALLSYAARCYMGFMCDARPLLASGAKAVTPITAIQRTHKILQTAFTYPVFFFDEPHFQPGDECFSYEGTKLDIGWGKCIVQRASDADHVLQLERNLAIGLVSWFALLVMTDRSTQYIRDAIHALASRERHPGSMDARIIRLAYTEAANQALPIQWTSHEQDLFLLEAIHKCWVSERWWRIVEQKTNLLAAHWEQEAGDANEIWTRNIAIFGVLIACMTLASAFADLIGLIAAPPSVTDQPWMGLINLLIHFRFMIGFIVPVFLGFLFITLVRRGTAKRSRSSTELDR